MNYGNHFDMQYPISQIMRTNVHANLEQPEKAGSFAAMTTTQDAMTKEDAGKQGKGIETEAKRATYKH